MKLISKRGIKQYIKTHQIQKLVNVIEIWGDLLYYIYREIIKWKILNEDIKHEGQMWRPNKYLTRVPDKENCTNGRQSVKG